MTRRYGLVTDNDTAYLFDAIKSYLKKKKKENITNDEAFEIIIKHYFDTVIRRGKNGKKEKA